MFLKVLTVDRFVQEMRHEIATQVSEVSHLIVNRSSGERGFQQGVEDFGRNGGMREDTFYV